jgi:hypothetical protein
MPDDSDALMPIGAGEFANTREEADALDRAIDLEHRIRNGDQFTNQQEAF